MAEANANQASTSGEIPMLPAGEEVVRLTAQRGIAVRLDVHGRGRSQAGPSALARWS